MPLQNVTKEIYGKYMILMGTEGYFSPLDDADKRSEKRKIKNQSSKEGSLNQINCIKYFIYISLIVI